MAEAENSQSIRNSTGKLKAKVKGVDDGPNYLRASTGSCHDVCKYGTQHEFKATPPRPVRRRSVPKAEIPVEILVPSDRKSTRVVKSSAASDASVSTKPEAVVSGRSPSIGGRKSIRQQAPSSMKVRSSHVSEQIDQETQLGVKSLSPDFSNLAIQASALDVKSLLSPDSTNSVKQESSLELNNSSAYSSKSAKQDSSVDVKSSSSSNLIQMESSLDAKSSPPDSSISVKQESLSAESSNLAKQESSLDAKSSLPKTSILVKQESLSADSSNLAKQESSSLDMKSLQTGSSSSVKKGSSSDANPPSIASSRKGSSSQRHSASKSTIQDVQSRRKSSSADVSGPVRQSFSKPARAPRLTSGSMSRTSVTGAKFSSPVALKSVKREAISSDGKSPLKNTSAKLGGSLKSKSGNGLDHKRNSGSKIGNDPRTSKEVASKKNVGFPMGSSSLKTRENTKEAVKNIPTSSTIALTPNEIKEVAQNEGSSKAEATYDHLNGCSDSKEPENVKVPEKTLHVIEVESSSQRSPGSVHRGSDIIQELPLSPRSLDSLCQSKSPLSSQDAAETNSESEYTEREAGDSVSDYDDDDALDMTEGEGRNRGTQGTGRVHNHEVDESALLKLKFRRGKVLDPQAEVSSPRRLRFRRRSTSGNDQLVSNERRRRSFKRRDANGNIDDTAPVGVKVELRHQDVQEKKNEQGLFNRVIEETANKLVETRKSKVMALVGAFETVISLQEAKPSGDKHSPHSSPAR